MTWSRCAALVVWMGLAPILVLAQETDLTGSSSGQPPQELVFPSPVLVVDLDRIYQETDYGRRIEAQNVAALVQLNTDNQALQEELEREESDIAARRETLSAAEFRAEADAFDAKVQDIRARQDERLAEIEASILTERLAFDARIRPILGQILLERRGVILVEATEVYLIVRSVDITAQSIAVLNDVLGDGSDAPDQ